MDNILVGRMDERRMAEWMDRQMVRGKNDGWNERMMGGRTKR